MRVRVRRYLVLFISFVFVIILLTAINIDCDFGRTCSNVSWRRPVDSLPTGQGWTDQMFGREFTESWKEEMDLNGNEGLTKIASSFPGAPLRFTELKTFEVRA